MFSLLINGLLFILFLGILPFILKSFYAIGTLAFIAILFILLIEIFKPKNNQVNKESELKKEKPKGEKSQDNLTHNQLKTVADFRKKPENDDQEIVFFFLILFTIIFITVIAVIY